MSAGTWVRYPSRSSEVVLSRTEAFELCEILAEAERALVRSGRDSATGRIAVAFELIEDRLFDARTSASGTVPPTAGPGAR